jgi:hypothetical protein
MRAFCVVDPFCFKQFKDPSHVSYLGKYIDVLTFERHVNELHKQAKLTIVDGYAPFCKHIFIENFVGVHNNVVEITEQNKDSLRSDYEARTEKELPVLNRWFPLSIVSTQPAKYLDIILYSDEQIRKENEAMGTVREGDAEWGIVSIKPQDELGELPMQPITIMRNALGKEHGGSGVTLDREKYMQSVTYWSKHAPVVDK